MRVGEISETVQGALVTALWWIAVAACNLSKSYASFCVKSVDLIGSDSARTDADANLNLNRTEREWEAAKERTEPNRAKGLAAAAAKIATQIDVDDLHSWWRWWWTSVARQKCSKKNGLFCRGAKGSEWCRCCWSCCCYYFRCCCCCICCCNPPYMQIKRTRRPLPFEAAPDPKSPKIESNQRVSLMSPDCCLPAKVTVNGSPWVVWVSQQPRWM